MAGLYIHVPFCRKACHYCDFHFTTTGTYHERMVDAQLKELGAFAPETWNFQTLYLGGGTPGMLPLPVLSKLMEGIGRWVEVGQLQEVTLEANPDDLTPENLAAWRAMGITRLSIGVQSFEDVHLKWMNRSHTAAQALSGLEEAKKAGFAHFSLDLIYGFEGLTDDQWRANIDQALALGVNHLSCYTLTVEPNTALGKTAAKNKTNPAPDALALRHYEILCAALAEAGWEHYEISNFARPGHRSVHNSAYWSGAPYLGIGPSAHSFQGRKRWWNGSNNIRYMQGIESGLPLREEEELTAANRFNEFIMTGLRRVEGLRREAVEHSFGPEGWNHLRRAALGDARLLLTDTALQIPEKDWLLEDAFLPGLFVDDDWATFGA